MFQSKRHWLFCAPALIYMALIFALSSRPAPGFIEQWPILLGMKLVHLVEYGALAGLWTFGLLRSTTWPPRHALACSVALTFAWGVTDEVHQAFVPGRTPAAADAFTNLAAALAWVAIHQRLWKTSALFRLVHGRSAHPASPP